MNKTIIKCTLDESSIDTAIKELNRYKQEFLKKVDTYRKRIAEEIAVNASINFGSSSYNDIVGTVVDGKLVPGGSAVSPDVSVTWKDDGTLTVIVATGEDAYWCEFGAGVYHNGSVGSSPHPYGSELGFTIGTFGKGHGKQTSWGYEDENGNIVITRGTPASMPMYNAAQEVARKSIEIAREVFG